MRKNEQHIVCIKNLYKMSDIFTIGQIRSFCERLGMERIAGEGNY